MTAQTAEARGNVEGCRFESLRPQFFFPKI
jgi:hypothetical protein